jgi:hypothetical protein
MVRGPPVEIYDETLAKLKDDLGDPSKAPEPSTDYIAQTADLLHAFATKYDSERLPREAFLGPLGRLLGADLDFSVEVPEGNFNGWSTEATIHGTLKDESCGKKSAVLVYLELKDEFGVRGEGGLRRQHRLTATALPRPHGFGLACICTLSNRRCTLTCAMQLTTLAYAVHVLLMQVYSR